MDFKLLGSILLIVGTSIGAGMLGLPIATAQLGFVGSLIALFFCWFIMTAGAFLLLEANLWLPLNSNLNSMARATIGPIGQLIAWVTYLLLLVCLLCAYISGGSDLFHSLLKAAGLNLPMPVAAALFTLILGVVVYLGIRSVDYVNRGLMFAKLAAYVLLIVLLTPHISFSLLGDGEMKYLISGTVLMVTITSFGYATIVPSLRIYFAGDVAKLKKAIFIGSLIPLICYIIWDAAIMGVIPIQGDHGLAAILHSKNSTSDLVAALSQGEGRNGVKFFAKLFTSICVLTSFLGVSLCLTDFYADAFQVEKKGRANIFIHLLTFLPPLIIVMFYPHMFIRGLEYAGICSIVLLILLPAWMVWRGRYHQQFKAGFTLFGGKPLLIFLIIFSLLMTLQGLMG